MKKCISFLLISVLCFSVLCGCRQSQQAESGTPTEAPTEAFLSYTERIPRPDQSIFSGPSYDHSFVGTVALAGTYTIVEEQTDAEGNLWGKLKSGAGWVDLTDIRSLAYLEEPITANFADATLLGSQNYHHCIADTSEYAVQLAFRANTPVTDFRFVCLEWAGDDYQVVEGLYSLEELTPEKPFVADVSFPGDMRMYGIRFTDSDGNACNYIVSVSGRNGSLVLSKYTP